jgi:hypothetical protein
VGVVGRCGLRLVGPARWVGGIEGLQLFLADPSFS